MIQITPGWLARHTPQGPGGRQAALIDIAQDLLLTRLHHQGVFDHLVFKGGTALRKLYAGNAGRFSTDLDFSVRAPADAPETVAELLRSEIDGQDIDGFRYFVDDHCGRAQVRYETPLGGVGNLTTKLDIGPAPWLPAAERGWVRLPIHAAYELPATIPVMALAENMAEKVARLTRRTPARDVYDLVWIASTSPHSGFDRASVRRLAVLKELGRSARIVFPTRDMGAGRRRRSVQRGKRLHAHFGFLADLDDAELRIVAGGAGSRKLVLEALGELPGSRFTDRPLY